MPHVHRFVEAFRPHTGHAPHHFDFPVVALQRAGKNHFRRVDLPAPCRRYRVRAVSPAEDAFVGAGEGGRGFHAEVGGDVVEGVFVAGAAAAEGGFGPPADLDARVAADDGVALFCEGGVGGGGPGDHGGEGGGCVDGRGRGEGGGGEVDWDGGFAAEVFEVVEVVDGGGFREFAAFSGWVGGWGMFGAFGRPVVFYFDVIFVTFNRVAAAWCALSEMARLSEALQYLFNACPPLFEAISSIRPYIPHPEWKSSLPAGQLCHPLVHFPRLCAEASLFCGPAFPVPETEHGVPE